MYFSLNNFSKGPSSLCFFVTDILKKNKGLYSNNYFINNINI